MNAQRPSPGVLTAQANGHGVARALVESAADLYRRGQRSGVVDGPHQGLEQIEVLEAPRATVALHDLFHRASEVDVDEVRAVGVGNERGRITHHGGIGAEDLDADGALFLIEA